MQGELTGKQWHAFIDLDYRQLGLGFNLRFDKYFKQLELHLAFLWIEITRSPLYYEHKGKK